MPATRLERHRRGELQAYPAWGRVLRQQECSPQLLEGSVCCPGVPVRACPVISDWLQPFHLEGQIVQLDGAADRKGSILAGLPQDLSNIPAEGSQAQGIGSVRVQPVPGKMTHQRGDGEGSDNIFTAWCTPRLPQVGNHRVQIGKGYIITVDHPVQEGICSPPPTRWAVRWSMLQARFSG